MKSLIYALIVPDLFHTVSSMTTNNQREKMPKEKKEYRIEIQSIFIVDVEANSPEEAKRLVKASAHRGNCFGGVGNYDLNTNGDNGNGAFFYEPCDWEKANVEEN